MNTQRIELDISKPDALTPTVTIGQGDKAGTTIVATVYDNGALANLDGMDARFECRLPDGRSYVRDVNCTVSGSEITYVVDEEHVASVAGATDEAYFDILDGTTVVYSTNRFRLKVLRSAHDGAQPAESWDSAVDDLIERGEAAIEEITEAFVPVSHGGTGATNATDALINLGALGTRATQGPAYGPLASVTAKGHAEQDGTPTPSDPKEIVVVRGRNLLKPNVADQYTINNDGTITLNSSGGYNIKFDQLPEGRYWLYARIVSGSASGTTLFTVANISYRVEDLGTSKQFIDSIAATQIWVSGNANFAIGTVIEIMLTKDNCTNYVPYGHVGLDVTANGKTTTTPIPLPSRGWVGALPDGTHDALSIDGAGKVTWELTNGRLYTDGSTLGSHTIGGTYTDIPLSEIGADAAFVEPDVKFSNLRQMSNLGAVNNPDSRQSEGMWTSGVYRIDANINKLRVPGIVQGFYTTDAELKSWLAEHPLEMYYPLATPVTESMGYVDLPDIPEGAVVSMPELEGLGVESWTSDAIARYVRAWAARQ